MVARLKGMNVLFFFIVGVPTLLSLLYFGFLASDRYISESSFVIRGPEQQVAGPLGTFLKGAGFIRSQDDGYAVQNFILSRDALRALDKQMHLREAFTRENVDIVSRFPGIEWWDESFEALHRYYLRHVDVEHDAVSSVVTLSTRAYTAEDSVRMNQLLLDLSESLVNQLNDRGRQDMIRFASREVAEAEQNAKTAALALAHYRDEQGVIDPERQSAIPLQQIGKMQDDLVSAKIQLAQLEMLTPDSPQIPVLRRRAQSLETEIGFERRRVAGGRQSLAGKAATFQRLSLEKDFSDKQLAIALTSLEQARNEAQRKQLYIERITQPLKPDSPTEPKRIKGVAGTVLVTLIIWGIVSLLVAGIREHHE
ncbi:MAG: hypothetical protein HP497_02440 [Nitrospira sp.]|nr:hypothetical protein [Nitrospira sp.]